MKVFVPHIENGHLASASGAPIAVEDHMAEMDVAEFARWEDHGVTTEMPPIEQAPVEMEGTPVVLEKKASMDDMKAAFLSLSFEDRQRFLHWVRAPRAEKPAAFQPK